jgi:hypothetical protein
MNGSPLNSSGDYLGTVGLHYQSCMHARFYADLISFCLIGLGAKSNLYMWAWVCLALRLTRESTGVVHCGHMHAGWCGAELSRRIPLGVELRLCGLLHEGGTQLHHVGLWPCNLCISLRAYWRT